MTATPFPLLPARSRTAFRLAFIGFVILLVAIGLSRWEAPLIGIVGFGLPLLFVAYLAAIGASVELPAGALLVTAGLGLVLGVGWALGTDAAVDAQGDALGIPVSTASVLIAALAIPLAFAGCLLGPVLLVRLWRPGRRTSLNGFMIGALSAYCFTAAGTLTRLAPEFASDPNPEHTRSATGMAIAAIIQGIALPVTAAAFAGAAGAALWFIRRTDSPRSSRWYAPTSIVPVVAIVVTAYLGLGMLDLVSPSDGVEMAVYAGVAVLALFVQRAVLRRTLRNEAPDESAAAEPVTCPQCGLVDSGLPYCTRCGDARLAPFRRTTRVLVATGVAATVVMAGAVALSSWLSPPEPSYVCPPDCGRPPISRPVATNPRFTPAGGEFSVSYPGVGTAYEATVQADGVVLKLLAGDGGVLRLFGEPAKGRAPKDIARQLITDYYQGAETAYEIPNAMVGYQLGYGEVADVFQADSVGDDSRNRVLVMVAVKNDYALIAAGAGPFREFSPDFGSGHPSGANFLLALDMGKYVNSFAWRGDPLR